MKQALTIVLFWLVLIAFGSGVSYVLEPYLPAIDAASEARIALVVAVMGGFAVGEVINRLEAQIGKLKQQVADLEKSLRR